MWSIIGEHYYPLICQLVNFVLLVNILQPTGVPHQLLRDLVRAAHAADPHDVPGDAHKTLALLFLRHLQVIMHQRGAYKIRRSFA